MSSLASYAAPFGNEDDGLPIKKQNAIQQKRQRNNKTMKRRDNQILNTISNPKLEAMMNAIKKSTMPASNSSNSNQNNWLNNGDEDEEDNENENDDEDEYSGGNKMGSFKPLSPPHSASAERLHNGMEETASHPLLPKNITHNTEINKNVEQFTQLPGTYAKQYQQQYIPYYNQSSDDMSPNGANKDELLEKLHQIIFMLEEHKNNKNANSTEEIILYFFLGIFIIFIIDSFARVGKYVR
jgi:hypothetical protein